MSYGIYLGRNRTHFKGVLKVQKDSRWWKIISWHCHDWRRTWLPRTQYFKIMTEETKQQAQQNPCSADDINSSGPPAQLGSTGSDRSVSLSGEKRLLGKWSGALLRGLPSTLSRDLWCDIRCPGPYIYWSHLYGFNLAVYSWCQL